MNRKIRLVICAALMAQACAPEPAPVENLPVVENQPLSNFLVTDTSVGPFIKGMTILDAIHLFSRPQVIKKVTIGDYEDTYDDYEFYDQTGAHLVTLTPLNNDSNARINRVLIIDKRFKTLKGVGLSSTYSDLNTNHNITGFAPDLEHIVLSVRELNGQFSIHKNKLRSGWWDENQKKVNKKMIPDTASFDRFVIWWK